MNMKIYAIIGMTVMAMCFLAFAPMEDADAADTATITVTSSGGGTATGGGTYELGDTVTLTATPNTGYHFVNWTFTGGSSVTNPLSFEIAPVMVGQSVTYTANFAADAVYHTVYFQSSNNSYGSVSRASIISVPDGASITVSGSTVTINGTSCTATATTDTAQYDYSFTGWSNTSGSVTSDRTITANFTRSENHATITALSSGNGSATGSGTYSLGDTVTLTATPASGYRFVNWTFTGGSSVSNPYSFEVASIMLGQSVTYTANFEPVPTANITVTSSGNGSATGSGTYSLGDTVTLTATPDAGYMFSSWTFTGGSSVANPLSFEITSPMLGQSVTYTANFTSVPVLTINTASSGNGSVTGAGSYAEGDMVTLTATPASGYRFVNWTFTGGTSLANPYSFEVQPMMLGTTVTYTAVFEAIPTFTVSFVANPNYGSFQPVNSLQVPENTVISVRLNMVQINNVIVTAVPNSPDGTYSYDFDYWSVGEGDTVTGDMTITANFTRSAISNITHWSNNMVNGAVTFVFNWPSEDTEIHNMSMSLWSGTVNNDFTTTWTDTGYVLNISASYPTTNFAFDLQLNGTSVKMDTVTVGKWATYELIIDASNGKVIMTPTATFSDFMNYTTLDSQRTIVFDFSDIVKNTAIQVIDHEDTGAGDHVRFSVTNTSVFLNTYGVVMNNPTINLYNHFPQYSKLRANFYGFALYGSSLTVNNTTYQVQDGTVTVSYATLGDGTRVLPSLAPDKPVETRTLALNNVSVTWDGSHCYLTFESDRFTIDLGTYQQGNELVSFAGLWYFTSVLYEPSTTTAKELGPWKMFPDLSWNQMLIIFLGVLVLIGAALYIRLEGSFIDLLLIGGAAVTAFILIW